MDNIFWRKNNQYTLLFQEYCMQLAVARFTSLFYLFIGLLISVPFYSYLFLIYLFFFCKKKVWLVEEKRSRFGPLRNSWWPRSLQSHTLIHDGPCCVVHLYMHAYIGRASSANKIGGIRDKQKAGPRRRPSTVPPCLLQSERREDENCFQIS